MKDETILIKGDTPEEIKEKLDDYYKKSDEELASKGRCRVIFYIGLALIVSLITIGVMIFAQIRGSIAENNIDDSYCQVVVSEDTGMTDVVIVYNDTEYSLKEFAKLDREQFNGEVIFDTIVSYNTGEIIVKKSYLTYEDVDNPVFLDNTYGRIILPQE